MVVCLATRISNKPFFITFTRRFFASLWSNTHHGVNQRDVDWKEDSRTRDGGGDAMFEGDSGGYSPTNCLQAILMNNRFLSRSMVFRGFAVVSMEWTDECTAVKLVHAVVPLSLSVAKKHPEYPQNTFSAHLASWPMAIELWTQVEKTPGAPYVMHGGYPGFLQSHLSYSLGHHLIFNQLQSHQGEQDV